MRTVHTHDKTHGSVCTAFRVAVLEGLARVQIQGKRLGNQHEMWSGRLDRAQPPPPDPHILCIDCHTVRVGAVY